ncbi:FAD dependent oxidoreductase-domain-containing protein [Aspergillus foveolatus]|uniref:FAD dependent oxidoreductase-domain-containing protein n=1 Tax=Aspergillus foveolatus TaxID=210207 RepID=UPI003CCD72EC
MSSKNVVFDVVGTLVSYDHLFQAIDDRLGDRLREHGIKPSLLGYTWIEVAEREYTYLSMSGRYTVFADVFCALFYRMLWMAGIKEPREFASEADLDYIMAEYAVLKLRPGAKECVQKLRDSGFKVWCFTAGDAKRVSGYFENEGVEMPTADLISCDTAGVGKPDLESYRPLLERLKAEHGGRVPWFAAGHMWDVSAARRAGFKGAYTSIWEKEPLTELFGEMDVVDETLPGMADKIIASQAGAYPYPIAKPTTPFWRTTPHPLDDHRSTHFLPDQCDIAIVGAGYAGASVAHHILELTDCSDSPSIVILEGREACSGATGRNGGHLKPDPFNRISTLASQYGLSAASEVAEFEARHVDAVECLVKKENIDCDLVVTEAIDVMLDEDHAGVLRRGYDKLVAGGVEPAKQTRYFGPQEAGNISGIKGTRACFTYRAGHLWPYKLIMHLLQRAVDKGVNLQTHTPVLSLSPAESGSGYTLQTPRGTLTAKKLILATNGYTASLIPRRIVIPPSASSRSTSDYIPPPKLTTSYMIRHDAVNYDYLIPRSDGSIVVGGARPAFIHDLTSWYNVTDDSVVLDAARRYFDGYMQKHFVGWERSGAVTENVWTGIMGYSSDNLPHVGRVPGERSQWILAGFTGHGMAQVFLAAEGVARMVVQGVQYTETGLPSLFETSERRLERERQKKWARNGTNGLVAKL